jgi:signal transduction histidine kinase
VTYSALGVATLALCALSLRAVSPRALGTNVPFDGWIIISLAVVAPLPLAARYPLVGWRIGWLLLLIASLTGGVRGWSGRWLWDQVQIAVLLLLFCAAGIRHQRSAVWWMWALTLTPWSLWLWKEGASPAEVSLAATASIAVALAVASLGSHRRSQLALVAQTERTELEQARTAVLEERARIARELHDVVAHHMSLIAVRAETAPYRLIGLNDQVRAEFESLSSVAREALADMRRLLGVLRQGQFATERGPQPRLSDLPALVEAAKQAGVPVGLSMSAALDQLPAGVAVCAYRIVQESLSNASQHAPGAAISVSVRQDAKALVLRIANGPGEPLSPVSVESHAPGHPAVGGFSERPPARGHKPGHGLAGMRERVAMLDGSLSVGAAPSGGFVVSAVLPLTGVTPVPEAGQAAQRGPT